MPLYLVLFIRYGYPNNFYHRLKHQLQSNLSLFVLGQLPLLLVPSTGTTPGLGQPSDGSGSGVVAIAPRARPFCVLSKLDSAPHARSILFLLRLRFAMGTPISVLSQRYDGWLLYLYCCKVCSRCDLGIVLSRPCDDLCSLRQRVCVSLSPSALVTPQ